jgi:hypothetical protein
MGEGAQQMKQGDTLQGNPETLRYNRKALITQYQSFGTREKGETLVTPAPQGHFILDDF